MRQTWLVYVEGRWLTPKDIPEVTLVRLQPGPGTVWETEAQLSLPVGCYLARIRRYPGVENRQDPLRYLRAERLQVGSRVERHWFRLDRKGGFIRQAELPDELLERL